MPIKVRYQIFCTKTKAPLVDTFDRTMAYVEFQECLHNPKGDVYRLSQIVEPDGALTKSEEYLLLVYRVRKLMHQYYNGGRKREDLMVALDHEHRLDQWNKRTADFIETHPSYKPADAVSHAFYVLVSSWRKAWKQRKNYSKRKDCDQLLLNEMNKECRSLEKEIDKYIKDKIGLI